MSKSTKTAARFAPTAKIVLKTKENPCREGSVQYKRFEHMRKFSGRTVETYYQNKGMAVTLRRWFDAGIVKVAA